MRKTDELKTEKRKTREKKALEADEAKVDGGCCRAPQ